MSIAEETLIFFYACLMGAILAAVYDVFRVLRLAFPKGTTSVVIEDSLFLTIALVASLWFNVQFCNGRFRLFVWAGEVLGFILYHLTVGAMVLRAAKPVLASFRRLGREIQRIFLHPAGAFFRNIFRKTGEGFKQISQNLFCSFFDSKFHLKRCGQMMYNNTNHEEILSAGEDEASCGTQKKHS